MLESVLLFVEYLESHRTRKENKRVPIRHFRLCKYFCHRIAEEWAIMKKTNNLIKILFKTNFFSKFISGTR